MKLYFIVKHTFDSKSIFCGYNREIPVFRESRLIGITYRPFIGSFEDVHRVAQSLYTEWKYIVSVEKLCEMENLR
jgi:hypothetical protein